MMARLTRTWAACAAIAAGSAAQAELIIFTHQGSGEGTINGTPFDRRPFTITASSDTADRETVADGIYSIPHLTATIDIAGLGAFTFITPTRTFANTRGRAVGFSRGPDGNDLFGGPFNRPEFQTWDMLTSIGPISGPGELLQWADEPVLTSGGDLEFVEDFDVAATFTASVVPAPAGALALALGAFACARRRANFQSQPDGIEFAYESWLARQPRVP